MRRLYVLGFLWIAVSGLAVAMGAGPEATVVQRPAHSPDPAPASTSSASAWFGAVRPACNPVEVDVALRRTPAPEGLEGTGFAAACLALAGRTDQARERISTLPADQRWRAAGIVFQVGHPVADAGDDRAAGPIMELVVEFWPNHYMALYHAGAARYALGHEDQARRYLTAFLEHYEPEDGWTGSARGMLERLGPP